MQNWQENTCTKITFLIKLQAFIKKVTSEQVYSCEFWEICKDTFLKAVSGGYFWLESYLTGLLNHCNDVARQKNGKWLISEKYVIVNVMKPNIIYIGKLKSIGFGILWKKTKLTSLLIYVPSVPLCITCLQVFAPSSLRAFRLNIYLKPKCKFKFIICFFRNWLFQWICVYYCYIRHYYHYYQFISIWVKNSTKWKRSNMAN